MYWIFPWAISTVGIMMLLSSSSLFDPNSLFCFKHQDFFGLASLMITNNSCRVELISSPCLSSSAFCTLDLMLSPIISSSLFFYWFRHSKILPGSCTATAQSQCTTRSIHQKEDDFWYHMIHILEAISSILIWVLLQYFTFGNLVLKGRIPSTQWNRNW